jgi:hypothetical protein
MKALYCGGCHDIRAFGPAGTTVRCRCGNTAGRIGIAAEGEVLMQGISKSLVRVLGIANGFLTFTFERGPGGPKGEHSNEAWRDLHAYVEEAADEEYLFHGSKRACPFVVMRVGETSDVRWDDPDTPE